MTAAAVEPEVYGSTTPRLFTPPLVSGPPGPCGCGCALTPETSYGFDVEEFAVNVLARPLDPWQRWAAIHGGELLPDGRPRFLILLILVARQNGKTELLVILILFWLFVEDRRLVLGTSTNLDYAKESWEKAVELAEAVDALAEDIAPNGIRRANGEQVLRTIHHARYKIAASNRKGGRSLTIHRLVLDELREHADWSAYGAAVPAMNAVSDAQGWLISNQGDARAVVLHSLRKAALDFIETGEGDERLGLLEWSAPDGSKATDVSAIQAANPNVGYRLSLSNILGAARRAQRAGGEELATFLTEILCMSVPMLDPAIDAGKWADCRDPGDLSAVRGRVALCFDVSIDGRHATLAAAAQLSDGRVRVEAVKAWDDMKVMRREMRAVVRQVGPRRVGWFPSGPAAAYAAVLDDNDQDGWPPEGVEVEGIRAEVPAVCMGFAELVDAGDVAHSDDPLFNAQVGGTEKGRRGDAWVFVRRGAGHCDATYAMAGAVHLARTLPEEKPAGWFGVV
ncbi:terminase [Amycolatopsis sp. SID8362]|uniref:terminase n=1 Tax=Amycolatopsis sp. SID8362 TaxID=2690346 RepID=UPI00136F341A|nr:terminase [Amycolatopsis sp. SID8362]NBH01947.1 terminase [Amycolatopsis sp. SID8362]NED38650.1 terminase [Amycolatopsis sp. SID8362]